MADTCQCRLSFEWIWRHIDTFALFNHCPIFIKLIRLIVILFGVLLNQSTGAVKFAVDCLYSDLRAIVLHHVSLRYYPTQ